MSPFFWPFKSMRTIVDGPVDSTNLALFRLQCRALVRSPDIFLSQIAHSDESGRTLSCAELD
jgi:hypothetical protein